MGRCRPVSDSEADAMESHCDGPEELALIRFFRHTAYRSNETSSLVVSICGMATRSGTVCRFKPST